MVVQIVLDADDGEGYAYIPDAVTRDELEEAFADLDAKGYEEVDPGEVEPHRFPDGSLGTRTALCRKGGA